jgi:hypothetical protein
MKWWLTILGLALVAAPWVLGYSGDAGMILSLGAGVVIALNGFFESYKIAGVAGLLTAVAPLILRNNLGSTATWTLVLLGAATALLAGYQVLIVERRAADHSVRHHA